jgi:hypothetical protein
MTCPVCYSDYTKTVRTPVPCAACDYQACTQCVRTYLTTTPTDPHCMNCKHAWNREFLDRHLTRSWREGEFKRHRERILMDREKSLLPVSQEAVQIELQKRAYAKEIAEELSPRYIALHAELKAVEAEIERRKRYIARGPEAADAPKPEKERRQFVAACPTAECRGFLSTAYKCGTCQRSFCAQCRELNTEDHTCDPALVATIQAILKDSRPCPSCGTAISRVSGCDQMYCTQCDTPFSYATGKRIEGPIHNPHYFERRRALQATGQAQGQCQDGWPALHEISRYHHGGQYRFIAAMMQAARHIENEVLPVYTAPVDNTDLRVRYLLNELDEKRLGQLIQQRDRRRQRDQEIRGPLELFVITTMELCQEIHRLRKTVKEERLDTFRVFVESNINVPMRDIGDRYLNVVPQINLNEPKIGNGYLPYGYNPKQTAVPDTETV